jgi:predicted Zn-dependent protease with MMP-like domain
MPRLSPRQFESAVSRALERIPAEFQPHLENVAIVIEEEPSDEVLDDLEVPEGETLLGAYFGVPVGERSVWDVTTGPDRIEIYRLPLLEMCETLDELIEEIEVTVVHEIAHHFGIDEETLASYGYD